MDRIDLHKKKKAVDRKAQPKPQKTVDRIDRSYKKYRALTFGAAGLTALGVCGYKILSARRQASKEAELEALQAKKEAEELMKLTRRRKILLILGACCLVVFCFSGYKIVSELWQSHVEAQAFEDLTDLFGPDYTPVTIPPTQPSATNPSASGPAQPGVDPTEPPGSAGPAPTEPIVYRFSKYDDLYERNNDLFGWISIDGTKINYPVMFTPNDPEYYLRRGFDKKRANAGTPFLDYRCYDGCGNYLVYGHRMNNGSMFRALLDYEKKSFWQAHPIIHFDTVEEPADYEIIAAFYSRVYAVNEENVFRYYNYTDLTNEDTFNEFMSQVYASARYSTGVTAQYGDQLLTLSTCSYHVENGRFVVVAKRIQTESTAPKA